nr:UPF0454 protein C12orf49 homolog isoform X2 [Megalopta genalis]
MDAMMVNDNNDDLISDDEVLMDQLKASGKPLLWQATLDQETNDNQINVEAIPNLNDSEVVAQPCRNSVQGKALIVDERGIVCGRQDILPNGCCSIEEKNYKNEEAPVVKRERYSCKTCNVQGCCAIYEYCVSCCLHPGKQIKGRKDMLLGLLRDNHKVHRDQDVVKKRLRNLDRFQICLAACRTSSASVRHENTYKDPHSKHCYALQPPYTHQRHRRDSDSLNNNGDNSVVVASFSVMPLLTLLPPLCLIVYPSNDSILLPCKYYTSILINYYYHVEPP